MERGKDPTNTGVSLIIRTSGRGVARMDEAMARMDEAKARMDKIANANFILFQRL